MTEPEQPAAVAKKPNLHKVKGISFHPEPDLNAWVRDQPGTLTTVMNSALRYYMNYRRGIRCVYCGDTRGPLKEHLDSGDLVCDDDAACLQRGKVPR